ncbi:Beta-galactosidase [Pontiella desulfatans]|uniref:Beta-galactosidase n=1 Tax=Pontiella desulfatans TaxID=2750659 RepID=A0A6C2UCM9_PONDE|nr:glycoside hydrolase family 2 protein [Pontiella desulfatans]VGO17938.1 Beta-galactosidase [Pontiella desulfatans]
MNRFTVLLIGAMLAAAGQAQQFSTAGFHAVEGSPRKVMNFNPGWRFLLGDAKGAEAVGFDDRQWEAANLPHGLEVLGENASGGRNYQGVAWYRKQFSVERLTGKTFLYFEAVMGVAKVWVNGQLVAEHFGGYLPFAADVTGVLKDGVNVVAVMADNSNSKLYPPGKEQYKLDFTYLGGIYRDTYLIQTSPTHVTLRELSSTVAGGGVFVATLDVNGNDATMEVRTEVMNSGNKTYGITVRNTLEDADGKAVASVEEKTTLKSGEIRQLAKQFTAKHVRLWHPDDPYLHFIRTDILVSGIVVDSLRTRVGIRLFEMRGADGLFVNKKWIGKKLIGANRHQDYTYIGNALPNSGQWRDVKLLREGGCNVIRAAHYPQDPAFYDACDEFGMLTTTANPGWHFFNFKEKIFEQRLFEDTRQLVRRDRNVAAMLMWETCINEFPSQPDYAMNRMHTIAHEEYPFPGLYTVADHDEAIKGGLDMFYHGGSKTVNSFNREYGDGGEVDNWYSQNARTRVKMEWGEGPLLRQSLIQAATLAQRHRTDRVRLGGTLWCGIDHQRGYHPDPFRGGLLNGLRIPRYTYYLYQSQYDPDYAIPGIGEKPMVYMAHELTQLSDKDVVVYSNCDEVRLTWMGEAVGTRKPSAEGQWSGLPHPPFVFEDVFDFTVIKSRGRKAIEAVMVAEGLVDGKVVVREVKGYPQRSTKLALSIADEGMGLVADGSDLVPVRATVVDENGYTKVLASEEVYLEIEGAGELVGDNPMKTSFGVATILVRATTQPGGIKVTAHSNGLESGSIGFDTKPAKKALLFEEAYAVASKKPAPKGAVVIVQSAASELPTDVKKLQDELKKAQLDIVGKDQDIMELRSRLGLSR